MAKQLRSRSFFFGSTPAVERKWLKVYGIIRIMLAGWAILWMVGRVWKWEFISSPMQHHDLYEDYGGLRSGIQIHWFSIVVAVQSLFPEVFDLVAGIGLIRLKTWLRSWFLFGWPLMFVALGYGLYQRLGTEGITVTVLVLSGLRVALVGVRAAIDLGYIRPLLARADVAHR